MSTLIGNHTIAGLTIGKGHHNLINSNAFLHRYKFFTGSLERSDQSGSETSPTFEKKMVKL